MKIAVLALITSILCSCVTNFKPQPYIITGTEYCKTRVEGICNFECIKVDFYNKTQKSIQEVTIQFMLYDIADYDDISPILTLTARKQINAMSGETLVFSLDEADIIIGDEDIDAQVLNIAQIKYEDGSIWEEL